MDELVWLVIINVSDDIISNINLLFNLTPCSPESRFWRFP